MTKTVYRRPSSAVSRLKNSSKNYKKAVQILRLLAPTELFAGILGAFGTKHEGHLVIWSS